MGIASTIEGLKAAGVLVETRSNPHLFNQVLKNDLEELELHGTLIQYVDDLLICSPTMEQCHEDSMSVLRKLEKGGHKVSEEITILSDRG